MSSLAVGKEFHNIPIMKIPDTSAAHHFKAGVFDQLATALKGKMGDQPILDLVYTLSSQIPMETSSFLTKQRKSVKT